jgi:opacity protein-like surface antigen
VSVGTEFEAEKMVGDWYEIRYRSTLGVLVTGYIHKMYVEKAEPELTPKVEEPMKPTAPPAPVPRQAEPAKKALAKGDFAILGGFVSGSFLSETSTYSASWNEAGLKSVIESGSIGHKIGSSAGLGLSFSYLFAGGLGIQVRYDFNLSRNFDPSSQGTYAIAWAWTTAGTGSRNDAWPTTGSFSVSPLSLNVIYKIGRGGALTPYISGGVSYLLGKVEAETTRGYGLTWEDESYQYIDWIDIPLAVDKSIGDLGFNVGGGFDFRLASRMAVTAEVVYFIGKTTQEPWWPQPGSYPGNNFPNVNWTIDQSFAEQIADQVTPLEIKTSFFKVQLGIKFLF